MTQTIFSLAALALAAIALIYAAVSDAKTMQIPNRVHPLLLAAGILRLAGANFALHADRSAVIGLIVGAVPLLFLALFSKSVGGGDVKLAGSAGFALGGWCSYLSLMAGLALFLIWGCLRHSTQKPMPFAPSYAAAALVGMGIVTILTIWR